MVLSGRQLPERRQALRRFLSIALFALHLSSESTQPKRWLSAIVAHYPDPHVPAFDVVQKVVGKSIEIAAPQPARIEVKILGILAGLAHAYLKLGEEVLPQLFRNLVILSEDLVEVVLDPPVKSNLHAIEDQKPARRK